MICIGNVKTLDESGELQPTEVLIDGDKIHWIGKENSLDLDYDEYEYIDGQGGLLTPGLIDIHVHLREPGFTDKETVESGSRAAARGGFTTICAMPNVNPIPDNPADFSEMVDNNRARGVIDVLQYAPISKDLKSETELTDFEALAGLGAVAFTNDGLGVQSAGHMYNAMIEAAKLDVPIVAHTEDNSLLFGGVMHEGHRNHELGLPGMLALTESTQIARDVLLAEATGCHYHVCHVSAKESVRVIRDAKRAGIKVTSEVTPHHLLLTEDDVVEDNAIYKMNPPLRSMADRQALIEGLLDGTIDCIATDHAPHTEAEKSQGFLGSPFGITGSETVFSLLYTYLVRPGVITLNQLVDWLTIMPAQVFDLNKGRLAAGQSADIAIFDIDRQSTISVADSLSKSKNTPFDGWKVYGETIYTFYQGEIVYKR